MLLNAETGTHPASDDPSIRPVHSEIMIKYELASLCGQCTNQQLYSSSCIIQSPASPILDMARTPLP